MNLQPILNEIVNPIVGLLFVVALLIFFWGIAEMMMNSDSDDGRTKGKQHMIWGIVGMFIMIAVYGIKALIENTIGL